MSFQVLLELLDSEHHLEKILDESNRLDSAEYTEQKVLLSQLVSLNLLPLDKRLTAIVLLAEPLSEESAPKSLYAPMLEQCLRQAHTEFEKKLILEIIVDQRKDKYLRMTQKQLLEEAEKAAKFVVNRPEHLEFVASLARGRCPGVPTCFTQGSAAPAVCVQLEDQCYSE
jgi:hypothetical protein